MPPFSSQILTYSSGLFNDFARRCDYKGNVYLSFSGGRSSAAMLRLMLDLHDGQLPENWAVVFTNTGKEHPATLDFIHDVERYWEVPIIWLELVSIENVTEPTGVTIKEVNYETAARNGEPFNVVIKQLEKFLPHRTSRTCTRFMKVRPSLVYGQNVMEWTNWTALLGFRADEKSRLHNSLVRCGKEKFPYVPDAPLIHAGIDKRGVLDFFKTQSFDLKVPESSGNCEFCFLKSEAHLRRAYRNNPAGLQWWIDIETRTGKTMFAGGYAGLRDRILGGVPDHEAEDFTALECNCTD
jgi:3'-phosphoadenosine 5'-phosphosulfate sulfotransferase (PAPS reductase)/FAD synthetase